MLRLLLQPCLDLADLVGCLFTLPSHLIDPQIIAFEIFAVLADVFLDVHELGSQGLYPEPCLKLHEQFFEIILDIRVAIDLL